MADLTTTQSTAAAAQLPRTATRATLVRVSLALSDEPRTAAALARAAGLGEDVTRRALGALALLGRAGLAGTTETRWVQSLRTDQ